MERVTEVNEQVQLDMNLNLNVRGLPISATLAINERCNQLRREGREVYKLGLGQSPFPIPEPVVEELRVHAHRKEYLAVQGLPELRHAVAEYHHRTDTLACSGEDVLIGPGSKELMFLLQLVYYGDLIIPTPTWVSYAPQAHILGRHVRWLQTTRATHWELSPELLDDLCREDPYRPRIVILNYPSNPTGNSYEEDELRELARVAAKYRVVLLSDEIYGELHHEGRHLSLARFYPEGTIISGGLSKWCGAGGWRLGTFLFPKALHWLRDAMASVASETFTSTSTPIQCAAVRAFQGGIEIERYLANARKILKALANWIQHRLERAQVSVITPQGAFYLFPDFSPLREVLKEQGITTSEALCERLLESTGVALLPGSAFGRPSRELTARLAYVDFDGARALTAAEQLGLDNEIDEAFLEAHCENVVQATERICAWLERFSESAQEASLHEAKLQGQQLT